MNTVMNKGQGPLVVRCGKCGDRFEYDEQLYNHWGGQHTQAFYRIKRWAARETTQEFFSLWDKGISSRAIRNMESITEDL